MAGTVKSARARKGLAALFAAGLSALAGAALAQDPPSTGTLLGDAKLIITSDKNDVRLWAHPPRVLVLYEGDEVPALTEEARERIEASITPFYGDKVFGPWFYRKLPENLGEGAHRMHMRFPKGGPAGRELEVRLRDDLIWITDIVIVVASRPKIAIMNGLWGLNAKASRAMMRAGRSACYYSSHSIKGVRIAAYVTIARYGPDKSHLRECVWEELTHTLGPLIDAKGSPFFTFDDAAEWSAEKQANDILLLKALYESGARPGDPPDIVLEHLAGSVAKQP